MKLVLALLISFTAFAQEISNIIKPLRLTAGVKDSVVISDIFYAKNYNIKSASSPNAEVRFTPDMLYVTPVKNFEGTGVIDFKFGGTVYSIPFKSSLKISHTFSVKPEGNPQRVNLFGSFNGWNREELVMKDNGSGTYTIDVPLDPGRYEYKFYIDGQELLDPQNPVRIPNGLGGFNSVVNISPLYSGKTYLHLLKPEGSTLRFYYEDDDKQFTLAKKNIIALIDNRKIAGQKISINGNTIIIKLNIDEIDKNNIVRIIVNGNNHSSNMQTVQLKQLSNSNMRTDNDNIIYALMIDRFSNGDTSNDKPLTTPGLEKQANYQGGDFTGVLNKINEGYFDSLGINTLWISPVIDNPDSAYREYPEPHRYYSGYHGYWPVNPTGVEEHFGNMALLKEVINTAHKHNIKVLLDYVAHHVHINNRWWKEHRDWFGKLELPDGRLNLRLWDEQRLTTWFEPYMPSFDFTSSLQALDSVTDNAVWWLKETGADGFRHDAVKHVPNSFWRMLTHKLNSRLGHKVYQIGETFGSYELVSSYVNNGQLSAQFNFNLYDTAIPVFIDTAQSFTTLDQQMQKTFDVYGVDHVMGNIMDSHDKVRFMAFADGDISLSEGNTSEIAWTNPPQVDNKESYNKLKLYLNYLTTIPGVPVIYYGDEIGMTGSSDPDNRRMMRFGSSLNVNEKETLADVRKIVSSRKNHSALRYGDFQTLYAGKDVYIYLRSDFKERVLVALNKGNVSRKVSISIPQFYDVKTIKSSGSGSAVNVSGGKAELELSPVSGALYILE